MILYIVFPDYNIIPIRSREWLIEKDDGEEVYKIKLSLKETKKLINIVKQNYKNKYRTTEMYKLAESRTIFVEKSLVGLTYEEAEVKSQKLKRVNIVKDIIDC
jgi:hypothetical protein